MYKFIFFLIFSISLLNAETYFNSKCVDNFYIKNNRLFIKYSNSTSITRTNLTNSKINQLIKNLGYFKYEKQSKSCVLSTNHYYGLNEMQFNFLCALTGLFTAFLIVTSVQKRL